MYNLITEKLDRLNKLNKQLRIIQDLQVGTLDESLPKTASEVEAEIAKVKQELNYK